MTQKGYFKNGAWVEFPQSDFAKRINNAIENIEWGSMNSFSDDITCEYASRAMTDGEIEAIDAKAEEERINGNIWYQPQYNWRPTEMSGTLYAKENLENHAKLQEQDMISTVNTYKIGVLLLFIIIFIIYIVDIIFWC
jgi:hypothetical protein